MGWYPNQILIENATAEYGNNIYVDSANSSDCEKGKIFVEGRSTPNGVFQYEVQGYHSGWVTIHSSNPYRGEFAEEEFFDIDGYDLLKVYYNNWYPTPNGYTRIDEMYIGLYNPSYQPPDTADPKE